ncbi:MAG: transcriptional regulator [Flavobacteriales bacterium]
MKIKLIKTEEDYQIALSVIEKHFDIQPGQKGFEEIELLVTLVDLFEKEKYKIDAPDPIEAIQFRMEQMGMKRADLTPFFGTRARVTEVLNRQRKLTVAMMKKLNREFGIPAESLLAG